MQAIKNLVKRSPLYGAIKWFRVKREAILWTAHDQEMFEFYSKFISRGTLCFDVGANVGNRVKIFLKLQANVVAIEPQNDCVNTLRTGYGHNQHLRIVQKAIGELEGEAEIMISNANSISSLSPEWMEAVRKSGRFSEYSWSTKQIVPITTLDGLIEQYGIPSFIKIDVEGFEYQVIKGLSQPVKALSLEFTPEFIEATFNCINHLQQLGDIRLNYCIGETMHFILEKWATPQEMVKILKSLKDVGDVYVQFQS